MEENLINFSSARDLSRNIYFFYSMISVYIFVYIMDQLGVTGSQPEVVSSSSI